MTRPESQDSLRRRLGTALTLGAVALTVVVVASGTALAVTEQRLADVTGTYYRAVTEGEVGFRAIVDAETAVRGYALTGDPVTLEAFDRLLEEGVGPSEVEDDEVDVEEALRQTLGEDHPALAARAAAVESVRAWFAGFAEPAIAAVTADGPGAVTEAEVEEGRLLFDEFRADMGRYLQLVRVEREAAVADLTRWTRVLTAMLVTLTLAALAVGVILWVLLRRWITGPLEDLAEDARLVAEGDVDHPVRVAGPGEVNRVSRDVELMRGRLAGLVREARASRGEIERSHALLEEQAEDLRRSNRDLEQFAYVASHDLQEPLRKVASFTQLLAKRYEGQLDERADQYIGFAVDGAKRMQRLINDLLSFSRVGRIGGEVSEVDMQAVARGVVADLGDAVDEAGARVDVEDLPTLPGEAPLLTQLLHNLVGNALKFRHPERTPHVRIGARRDGECWEFACSDNGIGIDAQYADRVFVIFQRLHAKDVYEGTGIGLALCKKIVEYHGGHIWIDTTVQEGTTIRWTLPVDATTAPGAFEGAGHIQQATVGGGRDD